MIVRQIWAGNAYRNFNDLIACPESGQELAIESRMYAIRTLGSFLEDLLGLGIDPVADPAVQGIARYQVDLTAEQLAEPVL